ncbi:MAG: 4Fe-4S dicluster domain-containing protein [Bacillota bacterium]|nr:4Fe-4S dicluster domain-containing protein [Bacillota bacterium]
MPKTLYVDTTKCLACRGCEVACKQWNGLKADLRPMKGFYQTKEGYAPQTYTLVNMRELPTDDGGVRWLFAKRQCMHCAEATCMMVCPKDAISRTEEGAVVIDQDKCIGCGYCAQNCPFEVPQVDQRQNKAFKCTLCADRIANGLIPACAKTCPSGAIQFGEREELLEAARARLAEIKGLFPHAYLYGEKEVGGAALYLLTEAPSYYGLPPAGTQVPWQVKFWKYFARPVGEIALGATALVALAGIFFTYVAKPKPEQPVAKGGSAHGN